jgi:NADPH:quinone reductase-like Zn-dependent oxidoreductase
MRAVVVRTPGKAEVAEVPRPEPGPGEVLVRVRAAGVNPIDCAVRDGELAVSSGVLGFDVAGVVEEAGKGADLAPGDEVLGMLELDRGGGYAEHAVVPAGLLVRRPAALPVEQAGGLPLAGLTAWQMLTEVAGVRPGQRVLVHAAAGGVGHLAVQVAVALGAEVSATARAAHHPFLRGLGAAELVDRTRVDFAEVLSGMDVVLNLAGGPFIAPSARTLRPGGVMVTVRADGYERDIAAVRHARVERFLVRPDRAGLERLTALVVAGQLRVEVQDVLPLERAADAHRRLETGRTRGKIVLGPSALQDGRVAGQG